MRIVQGQSKRRDELRAELARLRLLAGLGGRPPAKAIGSTHDGLSFAASETFVGQQRISDPGDLALLTGVWERMWAAAAHGPDATALIREAASS